MRNVLLVTYSYPPVERTGARRPAAIAKYLPRFGWRPLILTPKVKGRQRASENIAAECVMETDERDVLAEWKTRLHLDGQRGLHEQFGLPLSAQPGSDKAHTLIITVLKNLLTYPDLTKGWIPFALSAVEEARCERRPIDAILTTFPPASCHLIGVKAKQMLGCPWIADFRDLWTQDITTMRTRDLQFLQVPLEKRTLKHADMLITVSDPWGDRLRQRYPSKKIRTIPNGFDPDDFSSRPELTEKFTITYAGVLYQGQRDPTVLFEVLRELANEKIIDLSDVKVRFYSPIDAWLAPLVRRCGLETVVDLHGIVPRREVLQRQMESQILLLLSFTHPKDTGLHTGKLFEYLGAARPIVAIGGNRGAMTQVLEETRAGIHASSKAEVREWLIRAYADYKREGRVSYHGDAKSISRYSHLEMSRSFADALDHLTGARRDATHTGVTESMETASAIFE